MVEVRRVQLGGVAEVNVKLRDKESLCDASAKEKKGKGRVDPPSFIFQGEVLVFLPLLLDKSADTGHLTHTDINAVQIKIKLMESLFKRVWETLSLDFSR